MYESIQLVVFLTFCVIPRCLPSQLIWCTGEWRRSFTLSARVTCMSSHQTPPLACMLTIYGSLYLFYSLVRSLERVCLHLLVLVFVHWFVLSFVRYVTLRSVGRSVVRSVGRSFVWPIGRSFVRSFCRSIDRSFVLSFGRPFDLSIVCSLGRSFGLLINCWFVSSLVQSLVCSFVWSAEYSKHQPNTMSQYLSFLLSRLSPLVKEFTSRFPGMSLFNVLSEFSLPTPLSEHNNPLGLPQQQVHSPLILVEFS